MSKTLNSAETVKRNLFSGDDAQEFPAAQPCTSDEFARSDQGEFLKELIALGSGVERVTQSEPGRRKRRKYGDNRSPFRSTPLESLTLSGPSTKKLAVANDSFSPKSAVPVTEAKRNNNGKLGRSNIFAKSRRRKLDVDDSVLSVNAANAGNLLGLQSPTCVEPNQVIESIRALMEVNNPGVNSPLILNCRTDQSASAGDAELLASVRELDAQLEESAKVHNLKPINVKTILHVRHW